MSIRGWLVPLVVCLLTTGSDGTRPSCFSVPDLSAEGYVQEGDLMLGGLFSVHKYDRYRPCGEAFHSHIAFQYHEAMAYTVRAVNRRDDILPNISLGFVILDTCDKDQVSLTRAMYFVPPGPCNASGSRPYYDVVGVVSGTNSADSIAAANLLNMFHVPMICSTCTSETLSDKIRYRHFLRVVPSDYYQARVVLDILRHHNWTYISALNSEDDYGRKGIRAVKDLSRENGICVATAREILKGGGREEYDVVVRALLRTRNARVVVMFVHGDDGHGIITAAKRQGAAGHFIWIASDGFSFSSDMGGVEDSAVGGFFLQLFSTPAPGFPAYYGQISPQTSSNPWIRPLWKSIFDCTWENPQKNTTVCDITKKMSDLPAYKPNDWTALFMNAALTMAHGLHQYISTVCPEAFMEKSLLATCVKRDELIWYLLNVTFQSSNGQVRFDSQGDGDGKYRIDQLQKSGEGYRVRSVGIWDRFSETLNINENLDWSSHGNAVPGSICSVPCQAGEFYVQLELKCCWDCRPCHENEIVDENKTSCLKCPPYTWPKQTTFEICEDIARSYVQLVEIQPLLCLVLAIIGIVASLAVFCLYLRYRKEKLIKATSRDLSFFSLVGITLGFVTTIFLLGRPTMGSCYAGRLGFNLTFALTYAPLLAKVSRIYRIFAAAASQGNSKPAFIGSRAQMVLSMVLVLIQVAISVVTTVLSPPDVMLRMPVATEPFVELLCDLPQMAVVYPLAYNLVLILACLVYAFKSRGLPDNFNDSRYIFLCVCTTLFLWIAFIPSYFSAFYAEQKILLLSFLLLMNSTVILLCLYVPRIYAVIYVDDEKLKININVTVTVAPSTQPTHVG